MLTLRLHSLRTAQTRVMGSSRSYSVEDAAPRPNDRFPALLQLPSPLSDPFNSRALISTAKLRTDDLLGRVRRHPLVSAITSHPLVIGSADCQ